MGVLCINQVLDLLLLCAECVPCTVALLLYTGVENECRMAEDVSVLLTQHQRVVVERQDQGGVVVDPVQCLLPPRDPREAKGPLRSVGQAGEFVEQKGEWCPKFAV